MFLHVLTCLNIMNVIPNIYHVVIYVTLQNLFTYVIIWALIHYPMYFICICRTNDFAFVNHILIVLLQYYPSL